jgi:hypothetical protein
MNTPSFQPDEKYAFELANDAVEMLTVSALGFAVLELQEQLSQGRPPITRCLRMGGGCSNWSRSRRDKLWTFF